MVKCNFNCANSICGFQMLNLIKHIEISLTSPNMTKKENVKIVYIIFITRCISKNTVKFIFNFIFLY